MMYDLDGQTVKKMTVRVPVSTYLLLDDLARAARQPIAAVARDLLVGRAPKVAPPLVTQLSTEARELLNICHGCASNLTQLGGHAQAAGEPLVRLTGSTGLLFKMGSMVRQLGLQAKAGRLDQQTASELLARLEAPARALNDQLARPLNEGGQPPGLAVWKEVLDGLQDALLEGAE